MPFCLKEVDVVPEVAHFQSVLIVPCRFCPAVSLAVRNSRPFIEFHRGHMRTRCYEELIADMQSRLEREGVKTAVFRSSFLNYAQCMWTPQKRKRLLKRASEHEAVVVMGCEGTYEIVRDMVKSAGCRVFRGMTSEGLLNVTPRIKWPLNVSLELRGISNIHCETAE